MSSPFDNNRVGKYLHDLNNKENYRISEYYTAFRDALYDLGRPSTYTEIQNKIYEILDIHDIDDKKNFEDTLQKNMEFVRAIQLDREELFYEGDKYWISSNFNERFPENINYSSSSQPKIAKQIVFNKIHTYNTQSQNQLSPSKKLEISLPYWLKNFEKYARVRALFEASKVLNGEDAPKTKTLERYLRVLDQFQESNMKLIKKNGYLQELFSYLNTLDLDDSESNEKINIQVTHLYEKHTGHKFTPKISKPSI